MHNVMVYKFSNVSSGREKGARVYQKSHVACFFGLLLGLLDSICGSSDAGLLFFWTERGTNKQVEYDWMVNTVSTLIGSYSIRLINKWTKSSLLDMCTIRLIFNVDWPFQASPTECVKLSLEWNDVLVWGKGKYGELENDRAVTTVPVAYV